MGEGIPLAPAALAARLAEAFERERHSERAKPGVPVPEPPEPDSLEAEPTTTAGPRRNVALEKRVAALAARLDEHEQLATRVADVEHQLGRLHASLEELRAWFEELHQQLATEPRRGRRFLR